MRIRYLKAAAVIAALSILAVLVLSLAVGRPGSPRSGTIPIFASPSILRPGIPCRIEIDEPPPAPYRRMVRTYEGTILEADDQGVRLDVREMRRVDDIPVLCSLPIAGGLFRGVGIGRPAPGESLPPVEIAATDIRSVTVLRK